MYQTVCKNPHRYVCLSTRKMYKYYVTFHTGENQGITSAAKWSSLVNRWVCLAANLTNCMCAIAHQCNSLRELTFSQLLHFREGLFSAAKMVRLKNTASLLTRKLDDWRMRVPRINATVSKIDILFNCCILGKGFYFTFITKTPVQSAGGGEIW